MLAITPWACIGTVTRRAIDGLLTGRFSSRNWFAVRDGFSRPSETDRGDAARRDATTRRQDRPPIYEPIKLAVESSLRLGNVRATASSLFLSRVILMEATYEVCPPRVSYSFVLSLIAKSVSQSFRDCIYFKILARLCAKVYKRYRYSQFFIAYTYTCFSAFVC